MTTASRSANERDAMIIGDGQVHDLGEALYEEIVIDDVYHVRDLPRDKVHYVLDMGANVGFFAVMARMLFPRATIIAVEPAPSTFACLVTNAANLNITLDKSALGDGTPVYIDVVDQTDHSLTRVTAEPTSGEGIPTKTLRQYVDEHGIDPSRCLFKFDCEGGEQHLLNPESEAILRQAFHVGVECHLDATDVPLADWRAWLKRCAGPQHVVEDDTMVDDGNPWKIARIRTR